MGFEIGLFTCAFLPDHTKTAIVLADYQNYPHPISQYVLYQADGHGNFPTHYDVIPPSTLKQKLVQINCPGIWPGIWFIKLITALNACKEPLFAVWDEDDYFPPDYLDKAMKPMIENPGILVSWSHANRQISNGKIIMAQYPSPWGTMVARTDVIKNIAIQFEKSYPRGLVMSARHHGWHGPLDMALRKFIVASIGEKAIANHQGIRSYTWGKDCATNYAHHRQVQDCIGFGYEGKSPEEIKSFKESE